MNHLLSNVTNLAHCAYYSNSESKTVYKHVCQGLSNCNAKEICKCTNDIRYSACISHLLSSVKNLALACYAFYCNCETKSMCNHSSQEKVKVK